MPDQRHVAREYPLAQRYSADGAVIFRGDRQQDPYVSTSRSELKNYWAGDEKPTDAAAALPTPARPAPQEKIPVSVRVGPRDVPIWRYNQLESVDLSRLRKRAAELRDTFQPEQRADLPNLDALRSGDRRRIMAWILDAQLCVARLAGHDAARQWSVTQTFGAPADLADDDGADVPAHWPALSGPTNESLIPHEAEWYQNWRPSSSSAGSSRGSSRSSARTALSSSTDPRSFDVAPPRVLRPAPTGGEQRYAWPWRSSSTGPTVDILVAAGAPSRPQTADSALSTARGAAGGERPQSSSSLPPLPELA